MVLSYTFHELVSVFEDSLANVCICILLHKNWEKSHFNIDIYLTNKQTCLITMPTTNSYAQNDPIHAAIQIAVKIIPILR